VLLHNRWYLDRWGWLGHEPLIGCVATNESSAAPHQVRLQLRLMRFRFEQYTNSRDPEATIRLLTWIDT
jgi:hypothetical protein